MESAQMALGKRLLREPFLSDLVSDWGWELSESTLVALFEKKLISSTDYKAFCEILNFVAEVGKMERSEMLFGEYLHARSQECGCRMLLTELLPRISFYSFMEFLDVLRATGQKKAWSILASAKFETASYDVPPVSPRKTLAPSAMVFLL